MRNVGPRRKPLLPLDQFKPISERVVNVAASHSRNIVWLDHFDFRIMQPLQKIFVVGAAQRRMSFSRWTEISFDPQMNLHAATLEPTPSALGEFRGLRYFDHPKQVPVKRARSALLACRHG